MKLWQVEWLPVGKAVFKEYGRDDVPGLAAEMAYHFIFALFPFIIFLAALAGFIGQALGEDQLFENIMDNLYAALPAASAEALRRPLDEVLRQPGRGALSLGAIFG
ncbi:MAG: YhjD/YihY/BrkB family envelope integrity protein, partial [Chloroflexota bacterium]